PAATSRTGVSGRSATTLPAATASRVCSANADTTPSHTARARYRVDSTKVATNVLSGSSSTAMVPNAVSAAINQSTRTQSGTPGAGAAPGGPSRVDPDPELAQRAHPEQRDPDPHRPDQQRGQEQRQPVEPGGADEPPGPPQRVHLGGDRVIGDHQRPPHRPGLEQPGGGTGQH